MLIDCQVTFSADHVADEAIRAELGGYSGAWAAEIGHDPLLTLALAASVTSALELGTGIIVGIRAKPDDYRNDGQ